LRRVVTGSRQSLRRQLSSTTKATVFSASTETKAICTTTGTHRSTLKSCTYPKMVTVTTRRTINGDSRTVILKLLSTNTRTHR